MKKKLLLACLAFGMSVSAQNKVVVKGKYELKPYQFSDEYKHYNNLPDNRNSFPGAVLYWSPKYFIYNQDTIVLTYAFRKSEITYNNKLYVKVGTYKVEKITNDLFMIAEQNHQYAFDCENCDEID